MFLRSFADDHAVLRPNSFLAALQRRKVRLEETLSRGTRRAGPFVTIGAPGEALPELGAHRAYVTDENWQAVVRHWMATARHIVILVGATPSLRWELREIVKSGALGKTLLLLPPSRQTIPERWQALCDCLADTSSHRDLVALDTTDVLAVRFLEHGELLAVRGVREFETDYGAAARIAFAF